MEPSLPQKRRARPGGGCDRIGVRRAHGREPAGAWLTREFCSPGRRHRCNRGLGTQRSPTAAPGRAAIRDDARGAALPAVAGRGCSCEPIIKRRGGRAEGCATGAAGSKGSQQNKTQCRSLQRAGACCRKARGLAGWQAGGRGEGCATAPRTVRISAVDTRGRRGGGAGRGCVHGVRPLHRAPPQQVTPPKSTLEVGFPTNSHETSAERCGGRGEKGEPLRGPTGVTNAARWLASPRRSARRRAG
jgi:hypothetical protein